MRPLALSVVCMLAPAAAAAQGPASMTFADGHHADHAELHEPGPADVGVALVAAEILGLDDDAAALCHAARLALTIGILTDPAHVDERIAWFARAEEYARRAAALHPGDPDALFLEASALGLRADYFGLQDRVRAGGQVYDLSDSILALDPDHPGGLHIQGRLAASAMRLPGLVRFMVVRLLGGEVLRDASWDTAEDWLRTAARAEPENPVFRLELAAALRDAGRTEAARAELLALLAMPAEGALAHHYRERAHRTLAGME